MNHERIERELSLLREGGQSADLIITGDQGFVLYYKIPAEWYSDMDCHLQRM